jgi:hypothetical protein
MSTRVEGWERLSNGLDVVVVVCYFQKQTQRQKNQDSIFNGRNFDQKNFGGKTSKLALTGAANCRDSSISPTPDKTYFCRFFSF